ATPAPHAKERNRYSRGSGSHRSNHHTAVRTTLNGMSAMNAPTRVSEKPAASMVKNNTMHTPRAARTNAAIALPLRFVRWPCQIGAGADLLEGTVGAWPRAEQPTTRAAPAGPAGVCAAG